MKVLVAYMSQTGNTKKVAEAIFEGINAPKEIKPIDEVDSIEGYDLTFLGFPVHKEGPDGKTVKLLQKHCVNGRNVALFITHASPEDGADLPPMLEGFWQAAQAANVVDRFTCQGQLAKNVKMIMSIMPNAKYRRWAKEDNSQGQPDQARLEKARAFARKVMEKFPAAASVSEPEEPDKIKRIEYFHASKYGNGAAVAAEFKQQMAAKGVAVNIHHIREAKPKDLPTADIYLFSSPGRMGKPIGSVIHFLRDAKLPAGTKYAVITTEGAPQPDKKTGQIPSEEERAKWQRVIPIMNQTLQEKGLTKVAEGRVFVTGMKGPLEEGWQKKVADFASRIPVQSDVAPEDGCQQPTIRIPLGVA